MLLATIPLVKAAVLVYLHCRYGGGVKTRIQKWGNSLAVRIPRAFAGDLGLNRGSAIDLELEDGCLVLRPTTVPKYELSDLLSRVTEKNRHGEQDFGSAIGSEEW